MEHNEEATEIANEMESVINSALVFEAHPMHKYSDTQMFIIEDEESKDNFQDLDESFKSIAVHNDSIVEDCPDFRSELPVLRDMSIQPA